MTGDPPTGEHHLIRDRVPRLHLPEHPHAGDEPLFRDTPYADAAGDSPPLEKAWIYSQDQIAAAVRGTIDRRARG